MNAYMTQSDPVRIDDKILMEAVLEQLPQKQAKRLAQAEGIQFSDVLKLSLEYRCKTVFPQFTFPLCGYFVFMSCEYVCICFGRYPKDWAPVGVPITDQAWFEQQSHWEDGRLDLFE